ncbi:MAG TPA: hypothetical protein VGR68_08560 [Actinomycetota bacterium]|nr:hypothetical protein [Actinomycetota bacterium]
MTTADRSAPFRKAGSLLALLGLELAAVLGLHWLGRFPGLRIPWDRPVQWLLSSPLQEVLGAILRMVVLVMAYWLLASTLIYLVASLSRLPAALRALRWVTLPVVRRVADHAVAVTLATSMVGGGTVALAGPAGAAPVRGGGPSLGPPARGPVAAATATGAAARRLAAQPTETSTGQPEPTSWRPRTATQESNNDAGQPAPTSWRPRTATQASDTTAARTPETTAARTPETTAAQAPETTAAQAPETTSAQTPETNAAQTPETNAAQAPETNAAQTPETTSAQARGSDSGKAQAPDENVGQHAPQWRPTPAENRAAPEPRPNSGQGQTQTSVTESYEVKRGDNLWTIARDKLARDGPKSADELTEREIAAYWVDVVGAYRRQFPSGNPDLIYKGQLLRLPRVPGSGS